MPTYQYRCKSCGHEFDVVQAFTDDPLEECPECQGALKKVYGNVGIAFKGSGFYKNDARGSSKTKTADKPAADKPDSSSSSDSSSTAKPKGDKAASTTSSTSSSSGSD